MLSRHSIRTAGIRTRLVDGSLVVKNGSQFISSIFVSKPPSAVTASNHAKGASPFLSGRSAFFSSSSPISDDSHENEHEGERITDEGTRKEQNSALQIFFERKNAALKKENANLDSTTRLSSSSLSSSSSPLLSSFPLTNTRNIRQPPQIGRTDGRQSNGDSDYIGNANRGRESFRSFDHGDRGKMGDRDNNRPRNNNFDPRNYNGRSDALPTNQKQQPFRPWQRNPSPGGGSPTGGDQSSHASSQPQQGNYNNRSGVNREQGNEYRYTNKNKKRSSNSNNNTKNVNIKNEPAKTYRLADLMQQFRKDAAPAVPNESSSLSSFSSELRNSSFPQRSSEDRRDSLFASSTSYRSSWRQRYEEEQQQHQQQRQQQQQQQQQQHQQDGPLQRWPDRENRTSNRNGPRPALEAFLQGRLSRTEDEEQRVGSRENKSTPTESTQRKVVTLPNNSLTLTEASGLLRIKVDDIESKLREMGEGRLLFSERASDVDDDDNNNDSRGNQRSSRHRRADKDIALDVDILELLAIEFGIEAVRSTNEIVVVDAEKLLMQQRRSEVDTATAVKMASYPPRPPVVCIMGHVDHGKTTLMDALRRRAREQEKKGSNVSNKGRKKTGGANADSGTKDVAGTEAGGITQIISAFQVALDGQDNKITFLDTPGHAAFRSMRQSGSHAADVIVLVVAADDGVSPQTIEILEFYKSIVKGASDSGISMVVALNKIDKPGIDVDEAKRRVENQLLEHGIISEGMNYTESEYGQPVQVIPTSGLTGLGLDDLMEGLLLQSEIMDLRADPESNAEGIVMDARLEKGLGVVADCIIRWGKIEKNDVVISGNQIARVRMLKDVSDKVLAKGLPSQPVRIIGFKSLPKAGEPLFVVESEEIAEEIVQHRLALDSAASDRPDGSRSDLELHIHGMRRRDATRVRRVHERAAIDESDGTVRIPIIIKADADGSLSAVRDSLMNLGYESEQKVIIDPVAEGIGEITASDVLMAKESNATIFAFGLKRIDQSILNLADSENVTICSNDIIYSLLDKAKDVLCSHLPAVAQERVHGRSLVQAVFTVDTANGKEKVAGLKVMNGHFYKAKAPNTSDSIRSSTNTDLDCHFRVLRDGKQISPTGETVTASSLRHFKELVESVRMGDECGLVLLGFADFEEGDEIECYSIEMMQGKL